MDRQAQVIAEVFGLYERFGDHDYIGEPVSQIEHMSQAAELAIAEGFDDEVVLAAFFHDIGHLCAEGAENMGGYGVVSHERLGADYLRRAGFSERMARLVEFVPGCCGRTRLIASQRVCCVRSRGEYLRHFR